jgi:hypothetical protein
MAARRVLLHRAHLATTAGLASPRHGEQAVGHPTDDAVRNNSHELGRGLLRRAARHTAGVIGARAQYLAYVIMEGVDSPWKPPTTRQNGKGTKGARVHDVPMLTLRLVLRPGPPKRAIARGLQQSSIGPVRRLRGTWTLLLRGLARGRRDRHPGVNNQPTRRCSSIPSR